MISRLLQIILKALSGKKIGLQHNEGIEVGGLQAVQIR